MQLAASKKREGVKRRKFREFCQIATWCAVWGRNKIMLLKSLDRKETRKKPEVEIGVRNSNLAVVFLMQSPFISFWNLNVKADCAYFSNLESIEGYFKKFVRSKYDKCVTVCLKGKIYSKFKKRKSPFFSALSYLNLKIVLDKDIPLFFRKGKPVLFLL